MLETDRLILRDFEPGDFDKFYDNSTGPEFNRFYPDEATTKESFLKLFRSILGWSKENPRTKYQLAVCLKEGELIGTCGVRIESEEDGEAVFGCSIASNHWKKGYAVEAGKSLLEFSFANLPVHRIYSNTISENINAKNLVQRLGMNYEGELRENKYFRGKWWNTSIYSILRNEFHSRMASSG